MQESTFININGNCMLPEDAKISIFDRGFLFGDSIYEVTYSSKSHIYFLKEHIERLKNSAKLIALKLDFTEKDLEKEIKKTIDFSKLENCYIRIIITRGESIEHLSLDPTIQLKNNLIIIVKKFSPPSPKLYAEGIKLFIPIVKRNSPKSTNPQAKTGNYLNNVLAINEAKLQGLDDALITNENNDITEGSSFNIFFIKGNCIFTPHMKSGLLKGITRTKIIEICQQENIQLEERTIPLQELSQFNEAFICSTTRGVMPVQYIKTEEKIISFKKGPITKKLDNAYKQLLLKQSSQIK